MTDENLDPARSILRDLHRTALMRDDKHTSAQIAEQFADVAIGMEDLQTPEALRAMFLSWATREGVDQKRRAIKLLKSQGVEVLAWFARNGQSGVKPLPLFTFTETDNTRNFYVQTAAQYETRAALWQAAADKHAEHPNLPLGKVLDTSELIALSDASLEAEAV